MRDQVYRNEWTRVAFGDVVRLSRERSNKPEEDAFERYVGLEHLEPGDMKIRSWGDVADGTTFTNVFRSGQVLFGKRRAYQRKVAVADFEGVCSSDIYVMETKDERLLPALLPFICQTDQFFEHAVGTSAGSLSPRTNWDSLRTYEFALPPLEQQRRIADVLLATARTTQALSELASSSSQLVKSLSAELLPEPGTEGLPLSEVAHEDIDRVSVRASEQYRIAGVLNAGKGLTDKGLLLGANTTYSHLIRLRAGQLVLRKLTAWEGAITVVPETFDGAYASTEFPTISLDRKRLQPEYMARVCQQPWLWRQMLARSKGTALRRSRLHQRGLLSIKVSVPPRDDQQRIVASIEHAERTAAASQNRRAESLGMLKTLIERLFQLEVVDTPDAGRPTRHGLS